MNVVGFDVSKNSLSGTRIDRSGKIKQHVDMLNIKGAILPVLSDLNKHYRHLLVAAEATGDYHRPLAEACLELGIEFSLLNPITSKRYRRTTVRKQKTDITDSEAIARVAMQGEGTVLTNDLLNPLKPILRASNKFTEMVSALKLVEQHLANLPIEKPNLLKGLLGCRVQLLAASATFRDDATSGCDQKVLSLLKSIPGIGDNLATTILLEIGDIYRFTGPKQLTAFAGLDPKVMQSGTTLNRYGHLTKRGSPYLRRALYIAATIAKRHDPVMQATYEKKRTEGKRYKEAMMVVSRKLLRVIYAVWVHAKPYQIQKLDF